MGKLLTGLWLLVLGMGQVPAAKVPSAPLIVVFGDSLSAAWGMEKHQGWVELLKVRLRENGYNHEVINASVSGETTTGGLSRLPHILDEHQPCLVILELGGNDGLQGLPLELMEGNLKRMLDMIHAGDAQALLVGMRIPPNLGPVYGNAFAAIYPRLAQQQGVALVTFYSKA